MTNTQHTPGPWDVSDVQRDREFLIHNGATDIAVTYWALGDCAANARLIAAAPELLAALEEFCRECDGYLDGNDGSPWGTLLKGRAAIAKATGK